MKKTVLFSALLAFAFCMPTSAQLTQGNPSAREIKTGNRAQAGDFGIYMGWSSNMFKDLMDKNIKFENPLPLLNVKYMFTDRLEGRVGLKFSKTRETMKGEQTFEEYNEEDQEMVEVTRDVKYKKVLADNVISPGIAYHFSKHNIIDVYAGAELKLGWNRDSYITEFGKSEDKLSRASFQMGAGAFVGLQAYIGNLPLALGVEYGLFTMFESGLRFKGMAKDDEGNKQEYATSNAELLPLLGKDNAGIFETNYESLKASRGDIGSQFAVTLTYFFNR